MTRSRIRVERKAARAILRLEEQFPGDVGAMAPLFLNYSLIAPGESFFMAATNRTPTSRARSWSAWLAVIMWSELD